MHPTFMHCMPNQRHPDKKQIAIWTNKKLANKLDSLTKSTNSENRSELIEQLLREALEARGVKVPKSKI